MTKRKKQQIKDQPNLKKFRSEVKDLVKSGSGRAHSKGIKKQPSRKERRKEERQLKKSRKLAFSLRKPIPTKKDVDKAKRESAVQEHKEAKLKKLESVKKEKKKRKARQKLQEEEEKKRQHNVESMYDDKEIRELEKKLHLNKRKKKNTLPQSFRDDGLDYILDVVDAEKLKSMTEGEEDSDFDKEDFGLGHDDGSDIDADDDGGDDSDGDDDEDGSEMTDSNDSDQESDSDSDSEIKTKPEDIESLDPDFDKPQKPKWEELADKIKHVIDKKKNKKQVTFEESDDELENSSEKGSQDKKHVTFAVDADDDTGNLSDETLSGEDNFDSEEDDIMEAEAGFDDLDDENDEDEDMDVDNNKDKENSNFPELKEDIYGRLRDAEGNIVKDNAPAAGGGGSYIPPAKRLQMAAGKDGQKQLQLERLQKQLKGLVNRASENNIQPISSQIEELYLTNSRADVNESLISLIFDACVTVVITPERLAMELMMLVAILHGNVGSEVGAVFLQHLVKKLDMLLRATDYGVGKEMDNVVVLLAHLYNFKVVHSVLVFDVVRRLTDSFKEKDIELILVMLRNVGFTLRKDDPNGLKEIILKIQSKASSQETASCVDQSRVRFMLDVIMAIRNNNMRKIPNYDPEHLEHLRKLIRNYIRGGQFGDNQLHISLNDLLQADSKGKWWVVGSAWEGQGPKQPHKGTPTPSGVLGGLEVSTKLQNLARKQRMNTDMRRNIFYVIMTSEDYIDAFEKLLKLGLKSSQQQEIVLVTLDCCLQEKAYNPFYAYLAQKFCEHHRSFQMSFQFSLWDRFKEMDKLRDSHRHNLGKLLAHLFITKALSLSVLKVITFGTLEKSMVRLLKQVFTEIMVDHPQPAVEAVFSRIAHLDKLKHLHEGLKLFLQHFLVGKKKTESHQNTKLLERVEIVDRLLTSRKGQMLL